MRKLIQIFLVLVLICGLFQFVGGEPTDSASRIGSRAASSLDTTANTAAEDTQMAACLVRIKIKGVICVIPNVGWNT